MRPCVAYYKGFYYACYGMICKLQGFSIKIFFDFEIEIVFLSGNTCNRAMIFFVLWAVVPPYRGGGYTSRSRGGVSAENSDKNKKTFTN